MISDFGTLLKAEGGRRRAEGGMKQMSKVESNELKIENEELISDTNYELRDKSELNVAVETGHALSPCCHNTNR